MRDARPCPVYTTLDLDLGDGYLTDAMRLIFKTRMFEPEAELLWDEGHEPRTHQLSQCHRAEQFVKELIDKYDCTVSAMVDTLAALPSQYLPLAGPRLITRNTVCLCRCAGEFNKLSTSK
ncbi:hypothetical protein J6590_053697 [Homalodisca vitripennis]|nr:hypothetical protein J6590_053697 [Homalodisca vitripennis]